MYLSDRRSQADAWTLCGGMPFAEIHAEPMTTSKPHVLVVDDNLEMARTIADGLLDHGYEATALGSGRTAMEWIGQHSYDALVTDLRMPDVDGLALLCASRKQSKARPVIIMTAYSAMESAVECIRQGAYHSLTKPFKIDELAMFLKRALAEARRAV
jgi:two-component system response regulator HydG